MTDRDTGGVIESTLESGVLSSIIERIVRGRKS
jgi:hypothetical protein